MHARLSSTEVNPSPPPQTLLSFLLSILPHRPHHKTLVFFLLWAPTFVGGERFPATLNGFRAGDAMRSRACLAEATSEFSLFPGKLGAMLYLFQREPCLSTFSRSLREKFCPLFSMHFFASACLLYPKCTNRNPLDICASTSLLRSWKT